MGIFCNFAILFKFLKSDYTMLYHPENIEAKWRKEWEKTGLYKVSNHSNKPKYYVLDMFPYPSGAGLHVGHPLGYIASDIFARYKRLKGFNVLHPMGYDAFGLPAEQYAIQTGVHPANSTETNVNRYREQLDNIGFSFDWNREVRTSDPSYYKWTQWIFLKLFNHYYDLSTQKAAPISELIKIFETSGNFHLQIANSQDATFTAEEWKAMSDKEKDTVLMNYRLAYRKIGYVNWCEALGTVLANDEVKDGLSERGGYPVEKKAMMQWSLRITAYAERLLADLDTLEWTDALKAMQRNWIGKSEGAQLFFEVAESHQKIEIFTTRPDTIFGSTFMVLAPEHDLVDSLVTTDQAEAVKSYKEYVASRSDVDRMSEIKEVTGVFTGAYATNPFTGKNVPIWLGEYVLKDYGTGAIMAVPGDDERDYNFAKKFGLEIIDIVDRTDYPNATPHEKVGKMINSDFLTGMEVKDAITTMLNKIEERGIGTRKTNYKLRDANFSRQRYWGEPFPIMYNHNGVAIPLTTQQLPLILPQLENFKPAPGGKSPLVRVESWVNQFEGFQLETDTMPGFAGSSWYFLRYMDPDNKDNFASEQALNYWQDVDLYVGGTEHAVGHLMYSRFWHKFLYDLGYVPTTEPFKKLINQGMITAYGYYADHLKMPDGSILTGNIKDLVNIDEITAGNPVRLSYIYDYLDSQNRITQSKFKEYWEHIGKDYHVDGNLSKYFWITEDGSEPYFTVNIVQEKMSKSKFNVQNPDEIVARYGADCFRMYEMFLGPIEQSKPWDTKGIDGVNRFLRKYWALYFNNNEWSVSDEKPTGEEYKILHTAIKKITDDIERFSFNTCVSAFMMCVNELKRIECNNRTILNSLNILLAPFAPFITEELHHLLGNDGSVHEAAYPEYDEQHMIQDAVEYPVCVNGKKRDVIAVASSMTPKEIQDYVMKLDAVKRHVGDKAVQRVIVVPGKMINLVVKE